MKVGERSIMPTNWQTDYTYSENNSFLAPNSNKGFIQLMYEPLLLPDILQW